MMIKTDTKQLATATRVTYERHMELRDEDGSWQQVPTGDVIYRYFPKLGSSWIRYIQWAPTSVAGLGNLTVNVENDTKVGQSYTYTGVQSIVLVNILRGVKKSKSSKYKKPSVGATYLHYFPRTRNTVAPPADIKATNPQRRTVAGNRAANVAAFHGKLPNTTPRRETAWTRAI